MIHAMLLYLFALLRPGTPAGVPVTAGDPLRMPRPTLGDQPVAVLAMAQGPP
jgi:hypothetical protein